MDMGVPAVHGHLFSLVAQDHPGPPGHHRGRGAKADRTALGIPRHPGEPQLPGADRGEQFFPACHVPAQHVGHHEVAGQHRAEQVMIGAEHGGDERSAAREHLAGVAVACRFRCSTPGDQPVNAGAVSRAAAVPRAIRPHVVSAGNIGRSYPRPDAQAKTGAARRQSFRGAQSTPSTLRWRTG